MVVKGRVSTQRGENALVGTHMGVVQGISTLEGWCGRMVAIGLTPFQEHSKTHVGGGLLPMAVCQSACICLKDRHRERAPSHS